MKKFGPNHWLSSHHDEIVEILGADRVYNFQALRDILQNYRAGWKVPGSATYEGLVVDLENAKIVERVVLRTEDSSHMKVLYRTGSPPPTDIALGLHSGSYLCYITAAFLQGLTLNIPKVVYVNKEQSDKPKPSSPLTQEAIDKAFASSRARHTKMRFPYRDHLIILVNGKSTGNAGVITLSVGDKKYPMTRPERTLVDLTVQPQYAGGIYQVLEAYERAKPDVSLARLGALLGHLDYLYPYHQAVGFLLEKAGYPERDLARFERFGMNYDFYLVRGAEKLSFDTRWRLYVPMGMEIDR
ncbi:MAG TPA: hypothetical protein PKD55_15665 [Bellilinea sp.]|nr:hypothetical protein [Bellilinea sp.]